MSDRPNPTAAAEPPAFDYDEGVRHTYAAQLPGFAREMPERLLSAILDNVREFQIGHAEDAEAVMVRDLRSAAADLRFLAAWLAHVGDGQGDALERWEYQLGAVAEGLALRVVEIADELEAAFPPSE